MPFFERKTPRAQWYDYTSPGSYFITICTKKRTQRLSHITNKENKLEAAGEIVDFHIKKLETDRPNIHIQAYIIMPNHIHLILTIKGRDTTSACPINQTNIPIQQKNIINNFNRTAQDAVPTKTHQHIGPEFGSLGYIINMLKGGCTREINKKIKEGKIKLDFNDMFSRQSRYHDHIIKSETEYIAIKSYIQKNPENRSEDVFFI